MFKKHHRRLVKVAVAVAAATALVGTGFVAHAALDDPATPGGGEVGAAAAPVHFDAKGVSAVDVATSDETQGFSGTTWTPVSGSSVTVSVPSGPWRLASASFSGYTACNGAQATYCSVRIVARKTGTTGWTELYPRASLNYAIDSAGPPASPDYWEGHSVDRSKTLSPGVWTVRAEGATSDAGTNLVIGTWHHKVELYVR